MPYIDVDSGTILNGPIVFVHDQDLPDDPTDQEARDIAENFGFPLHSITVTDMP